ncbi:Env9p [Dipodascopsis uninucleata]
MASLRDYIQMLGHLRPYSPKFLEKDYPDLEGKVCIVTGGATGIGFEVSKRLLEKKAKVYIAARDKGKLVNSIAKIKSDLPSANVDYFIVDYCKLSTVKEGVQKFLDNESRLDIVFHNAGVMAPPAGSKTDDGYELHLGVNDIGPFLLQKYLDKIIIKTAKISPPNSVRIIWVSSSVHALSPFKGGINWDDINNDFKCSFQVGYGQSKAINVYQSILWPKYHEGSGVVSLSVHPGNIKSELQRYANKLQKFILSWIIYPTQYGAYTELYAALCPDLTEKNDGAYIIPFGKVGFARQDIINAANGPEGKKLWEYLDTEAKKYT